ncbi:MAG: nucleotidyltransferase domain-containing protein [Elusimicrobia bacterium]|nr:nucleotidyltransferase domain-containing protein [Elusimicrobiota bacterium]
MTHKINFLQQPLNWILSAQSSIAVIRALKDSKEGMSGRAVARAAGFTHQACRQALSRLNAVGFIDRQGSGKTQLVRLNFNHVLVKNALLPLFRAEKHFTRSIREEIRKEFKLYARSATLFGSIARKEDEPGSDVDLLLIADEKNKLRLLNKARAFEKQFILQYGIRLSPMVFTTRNARARYKKSDPLLKNILSHGIDLLKEHLKDVLI